MDSKGKKILLIEDEMFVRQLYERVLKQAGYDVVVAIDGKEGVRLASDMPDLILLDIMLPKLNGIDVLKHIRNDTKAQEIPIILITNLGERDILEQAFALGIHGYLLKMRISPYDLVTHVRDFFANPVIKRISMNDIIFD